MVHTLQPSHVGHCGGAARVHDLSNLLNELSRVAKTLELASELRLRSASLQRLYKVRKMSRNKLICMTMLKYFSTFLPDTL